MTSSKPTTTLTKYEVAANLAALLTDKTGTCFGNWTGRMTATEQRAVFGAYRFGKKVIEIFGDREVLTTTHKVAFGQDWETAIFCWRDLGAR